MGGRALSRQAVISNLLDKWTLLCFDSIPATPAENKWLTLSPMIAWTIVTFCLFFIGTDAFLMAFDGHVEFNEDEPHQDLAFHDMFKVLNGKRMRTAKNRLRGREAFLLHLLGLLMVSRCIERFIALNIRAVGAMFYVDFALLRDQRRQPGNGIWEMPQDEEDFQPTLYDLYRDNLKEIRDMKEDLTRLLCGCRRKRYTAEQDGPRLPDIHFLVEACGTSYRGGPDDGRPTPGLPLSKIIQYLRSLALSAYFEVEIRFVCHYEKEYSFPPRCCNFVVEVDDISAQELQIFRESEIRVLQIAQVLHRRRLWGSDSKAF